MAPGRRLLVTNTSESWGGNEAWALDVASGLAGRGHEVRFLWTHEAVGARVKARGLPHARIRLRSDADLAGCVRLSREMASLGADAVLLTRWREYLLGGIAARFVGHPRVVLRLGLRVVPRDDLKRRLVFALGDRIIVNAPEIREGLTRRAWIDRARIAVVLNGLDLDAWRPRWEEAMQRAGAAFRREMRIGDNAPLLLAVGSLTPQKDHATLLRAAADIGRDRPDARLVLVGEGFLRETLEAGSASLGLAGRVLLPGFRTDIMPALAAADLFVLSSVNEGMSRALIEAVACGLPVVATDVSGVRACVIDGVTGRVVSPGDAGALASAARDLLADPARRDAMGRRARELAEERFDVRRMLDETEAVLFESGDAS